MKAAVLYEPNSPLRVEEVTLDEPQADEVLVKIVAIGVCHTDLHVIKGDIPIPMPVVLGHEAAGIVEKVGPCVTTLQPGDHAVLMAVPSCGKCRNCTSGRPFLCSLFITCLITGGLPGGGRRLHKDGQEVSQFFAQGSFAEYAVVHERTAVKVRDDAPLETVCLLGCCASTGVGAVINAAGLKTGESIAIYGCGGVGLSAVMGAKVAGAGKIIAVDVVDSKLQMARELGAHDVVNASQENPTQRVLALTGGADYAIECIGKPDVIEQAFNSIRFGGKCVLVGTSPAGSVLGVSPTQVVMGKTITGSLQGSIVPSIDVPKYADWYMEGKLPIDKLITRHYGLDGVNEAFEALEKGVTIRSIIKI